MSHQLNPTTHGQEKTAKAKTPEKSREAKASHKTTGEAKIASGQAAEAKIRRNQTAQAESEISKICSQIVEFGGR
ncbi:MAG: hypothetical protein ACREH8_16930 [Opitutaceae bacterium]